MNNQNNDQSPNSEPYIGTDKLLFDQKKIYLSAIFVIRVLDHTSL